MIDVNFDKLDGLIPVVVQDFKTLQVLMVAFMNKEAYEKTVETKKATYFSRTRNKLWVKGETSGNVQIVKDIFLDCDDDTLLLLIEQVGEAACHTGYRSCFFKKLIGDNDVQIVGDKVVDPKDLYRK